MWLLFALGSAVFAGVTAVLAKVGIREVDSTLATAVRTVVVLAFSWLMVFVTGAQSGLASLSGQTLLLLCLSGLATGASWLCYFRALQLGDVNQVAPIDKSSVVLTILLALVLLGEPISWGKAAGMAGIGAGTLLMVDRKRTPGPKMGRRGWLFFAVLSAVFASLTAILGKVGLQEVDSNLGTAVRTCVVLAMAWLMVAVSGKGKELAHIGRRGWAFLCLSGVTTGLSWLCYYKALQKGPASVVVPVDKLSVLVTVAFSGLVLHERLSRRAACGLILLVAGTLCMLL